MKYVMRLHNKPFEELEVTSLHSKISPKIRLKETPSNRISFSHIDIWTHTDGVTSTITINDGRVNPMKFWVKFIKYPVYWSDFQFMCQVCGGVYHFADWLETASSEDIDLRFMEKKLGDLGDV